MRGGGLHAIRTGGRSRGLRDRSGTRRRGASGPRGADHPAHQAESWKAPAGHRTARSGGRTAEDDFNSDGCPDLAVGMPGATVNGKPLAGYVAVVYGSAAGLRPEGRRVLHQSNAGIPGTVEGSERFGWSLTGADVNSDGDADLVVTSPLESLGTYGEPDCVGGAGSVTVARALRAR